MITSDRQFATSQKKMEMLIQSLNAPTVSGVPDEVIAGGKAQIQELIDEIQAEITEYETLIAGKVEDLAINTVEDLMLTPIRYRLVKHLSVEAFGREVGVSARQIHRYEAEQYNNANTSTLKKILGKIDVSLEGHVSSS